MVHSPPVFTVQPPGASMGPLILCFASLLMKVCVVSFAKLFATWPEPFTVVVIAGITRGGRMTSKLPCVGGEGEEAGTVAGRGKWGEEPGHGPGHLVEWLMPGETVGGRDALITVP